MLKCQFHCHSSDDPIDNIPYSSKKLIEEAAKLKYDVLSITLHNKFFYNKELEEYAKALNILLIPGIELEIDFKHILCINVDKNIEKVKSFKDLKSYKQNHPDCFVIAAHPFFPGKVTLKKELIKNIEIFDGIENSFCYTKTVNFNKKAEKIAKKYKKPIIATSDCHVLNYLNLGYTEIKAEKNAKSIKQAIKKGHIKAIHKPIGLIKAIYIVILIEVRNILKKLQKRA
jgi:predicted metal-dependent phosphoesterase TrpH